MSPKKLFALALLIPFSVLSFYAVMQVGYRGIIDYQLHSPAGWQVITDLVIAIVLLMMWMVRDARETGRNAVPYLVISLLLGSFGPLLYLLFAPESKRSTTGD